MKARLRRAGRRLWRGSVFTLQAVVGIVGTLVFLAILGAFARSCNGGY